MTDWIPRPTQDGSFTFFSERFNETFHSKQGARTEAIEKFALATQLPELAQASLDASPSEKRDPIRILDVCYGLGINTAAALETIWQINPHCPVELYGLELDASVPSAAIAPALIQTWSPPVQQALIDLAPGQPVQTSTLTAQILIGDARQTITQLQEQSFQAQAIFFDPFSPRRCPQLWTTDFFQQVARCLDRHGRLATYSRSASVRTALKEAGFRIGTMPLAHPDPKHPHEWAQGTLAVLTASDAPLPPLSPMEQEHLQTRAGIALRDPSLGDEASTILTRQQQTQSQCDRESTSSWRRRWGLG